MRGLIGQHCCYIGTPRARFQLHFECARLSSGGGRATAGRPQSRQVFAMGGHQTHAHRHRRTCWRDFSKTSSHLLTSVCLCCVTCIVRCTVCQTAAKRRREAHEAAVAAGGPRYPRRGHYAFCNKCEHWYHVGSECGHDGATKINGARKCIELNQFWHNAQACELCPRYVEEWNEKYVLPFHGMMSTQSFVCQAPGQRRVTVYEQHSLSISHFSHPHDSRFPTVPVLSICCSPPCLTTFHS